MTRPLTACRWPLAPGQFQRAWTATRNALATRGRDEEVRMAMRYHLPRAASCIALHSVGRSAPGVALPRWSRARRRRLGHARGAQPPAATSTQGRAGSTEMMQALCGPPSSRGIWQFWQLMGRCTRGCEVIGCRRPATCPALTPSHAPRADMQVREQPFTRCP